MSEYKDLMEGINQAIAYERGILKGVRKRLICVSPLPQYRSLEIKKIRNDLKLSQAMFAALLGVSPKTVEAWESGKNIPEGPAQRMLDLLKNEPGMLENYIVMKQG